MYHLWVIAPLTMYSFPYSSGVSLVAPSTGWGIAVNSKHNANKLQIAMVFLMSIPPHLSVMNWYSLSF
jgi:hypothetical protein